MGWVVLTYLAGGDYSAANIYGREEYELLQNDPYKFFTDLFDARYTQGYGGLFDSAQSFWHDLAGNCLYKLIGLFNIFSRGNFYINTLFLNFIGFFGHVALFRVFNEVYQNRKWALIIGCFLIPSTLYFSSGLHKDNLVFTSVCLFSFALFFLSNRSFSVKKLLLLLIAAAVIFLIRNFVLLAMIPAALAMWIACKTGRPWKSFLVVYALGILSLIVAVQFLPSHNPLHIITRKQQDFAQLSVARTQVSMDTLQPTLRSFVKNIPAAIEHSILRPFIWEKSVPFIFIPGIEILFYLILIITALIIQRRHLGQVSPFVLYGIFFSMTIFMFIGLVVPNMGSIIRYRSLYFPFLLTPAIVTVFYHINKNKI